MSDKQLPDLIELSAPIEETLKRAYYYNERGKWRGCEAPEWDRWHSVAKVAAAALAAQAENHARELADIEFRRQFSYGQATDFAAELDALRADRDSWERQCVEREKDAVAFAAERDALRAKLAYIGTCAERAIGQSPSAMDDYLDQISTAARTGNR